MDAFEYDPEGTTLAELQKRIPNIVQLAQQQLDMMEQQPDAKCTDLGALMPREINTIARAYNNLMSIYARRFPRYVHATRFLHLSVHDVHDVGVCPVHVVQLVVRHQRATKQFALYTNDFTITFDMRAGQVPLPRLPELAAIVKMFEKYVEYRKTLRICEVLGGKEDLVLIQDREFISVDHYERSLGKVRTSLDARRAVCVPQSLCVNCCPCVATLMFCMLGAPDDTQFRMSYPDRFDQEFFMADPRPGADVITSKRLQVMRLTDVQNALLWYFAGCSGPMVTLFEVATALREEGLHAQLALVQDVAVYSFLAFKNTPQDARRKQTSHILPSLQRRQLYDAVNDAIITCRRDFNPVS